MRTVAVEPTYSLEEATLLQEPCHLLVFPLPRLALQTERPEVVARRTSVAELVERLLDEAENDGERLEIEGLRLPALDVADHFRCLLAFAEIDEAAWKHVGISVLDELQGREEDTYKEKRSVSLQISSVGSAYR